MEKDNILLKCWYRIWNRVNTNRLSQSDVLKKFEFIEHILKGHNVDTSKYTLLELIIFIDNVTKTVIIDKCDWPLITRIVNCVNIYYTDVDNINTTEDVDTINTTEDRLNTPKEAQNELLKVLKSIFDSSDQIRECMFGTYRYYDILKLDPDKIITKYNNYIKSTDYKISDEICMKNNSNMKGWITKIYVYDFDCLLDDGSVRCVSKTDVKKTGRHNVSLGAVLQDNMESCIILEDVNND